jgi:hypothetical protein
LASQFFFEQFVNRKDCFDALYRTWSLTHNSSSDQLSSVFDPLGGLSAVTSSSMRSVVASPSESHQSTSDFFPSMILNKKFPPSPSKALSTPSVMSMIKPTPPPPALVSSPVSASNTKQHVQPSSTAAAASTVAQKQGSHTKGPHPVEHHCKFLRLQFCTGRKYSLNFFIGCAISVFCFNFRINDTYFF